MTVDEILTDENFDTMGWHDSSIYSISFPAGDFQLSFDIDYIFKWELDKEKNQFFFWVSPCTLSFTNVTGLIVNLDLQNYLGIDIADIRRTDPKHIPEFNITYWNYIIETNQGEITFQSTGFIQKVLKQPVFGQSQAIGRDV